MKRLLIALLLLTPLMANAVSFSPSGENVSLSASTTSANVQFTRAASVNATNVVVYNAASNAAVVKCGGSTVTATVPTAGVIGGFLVPPGFSYEIYKGNAAYCAAVLTSSTGTIYFSAGADQ